MARLVNLTFGGTVAASETTVDDIWNTYKAIADGNGLVRKPHGFVINYHPSTGTVVSVEFWYQKNGMLESQLQIFNESWYNLAVQYSIARLSTEVEYYTG